jgi:glycosyltransferase involved in cell wall biosynthesis
MPRRRLAIITTHPIQYYAPVFRALARSTRIEPLVFYTWSQSAEGASFDPGFGARIAWDLPLREGYAHRFVHNVAARPGTDRYAGIDNPTLIADIEAWRPDALLVYGWNARSHLEALRHFKGRVPIFFRGDSTLLDPRSWWHDAARRAFLRWVYAHVDVALAVGSHNRDYFAWCGLAAARIDILPHSVDTRRFADDAALHEARAQAWRGRLGIGAPDLVFLFAGKLQAKKNPRLLLDAFAAVESAAHLVFVGQGELEDELKRVAAGNPRVHFQPFQNQSAMPAVYRLGDVLVLPSQGPGETWGLALNEAMASGRPVIASSRVGGARDLVEPGLTGWTFASGDRSGLAEALGEALRAGCGALRRMGGTALARASLWSSEASALGLEEIIMRRLVPAQPDR